MIYNFVFNGRIKRDRQTARPLPPEEGSTSIWRGALGNDNLFIVSHSLLLQLPTHPHTHTTISHANVNFFSSFKESVYTTYNFLFLIFGFSLSFSNVIDYTPLHRYVLPCIIVFRWKFLHGKDLCCQINTYFPLDMLKGFYPIKIYLCTCKEYRRALVVYVSGQIALKDG